MKKKREGELLRRERSEDWGEDFLWWLKRWNWRREDDNEKNGGRGKEKRKWKNEWGSIDVVIGE